MNATTKKEKNREAEGDRLTNQEFGRSKFNIELYFYWILN